MPVITSQARPMPIADEASFRAPKKTITQSTGMDLKQSLSGAPQEEIRQEDKVVETESPKEVTLSPQLTALARKEAKFRQQEQAFKVREQAVAAKEAEFGKLTELKTRLVAKDFSVLDEIGVDYEAYTNYAIAKLNGIDPAQEAIKALEKKVNTFEEQQKANVTKQHDAAVNQYKRDIKNTVDSNPEYAPIKKKGAEDHVLQHILDTFNEDGEILTIDQAAKEVKEALLEEAKEWISLIEEVKPIQEPAKILPPPKLGLRTLTNQVTQTSPSAPRNQFQHLSPKERIAQAIARAQKAQG